MAIINIADIFVRYKFITNENFTLYFCITSWTENFSVIKLEVVFVSRPLEELTV